MILLLIALIPLAVILNMTFYEMRVVKNLFKEPEYISKSYSKLILLRRYK